jgi:hypothetical protein
MRKAKRLFIDMWYHFQLLINTRYALCVQRSALK